MRWLPRGRAASFVACSIPFGAMRGTPRSSTRSRLSGRTEESNAHHGSRRRHELGLHGRVLPDHQRRDQRAARRTVVGADPALLRGLRRDRRAPGTGRLRGRRLAPRRRGGEARERGSGVHPAVREHAAHARRARPGRRPGSPDPPRRGDRQGDPAPPPRHGRSSRHAADHGARLLREAAPRRGHRRRSCPRRTSASSSTGRSTKSS